jgi:hypothetical protein
VDTNNFNRQRLSDVFYTDTLFSKVKSLNGNVCAQLYTNGRCTRVFLMPSKSSEHIAQTLREFVDDVGIPKTLICDLVTEQVGTHNYVSNCTVRSRANLFRTIKWSWRFEK